MKEAYSIRYNIVDGKKKRTKEYIAWLVMRRRCNNPNHETYIYYGGRGIKVCSSWSNSFDAFYEDMGKAPSEDHQIDRINNDKGYSADNCCWSTRKEQCNNRGNSRLITHDGITKTIAQWSDYFGLDQKIVSWRLIHGYPFYEAVKNTNFKNGKMLKSATGNGG